MNKCGSCKFCEERLSAGLFNTTHKYLVCNNDKAFVFRPQTFFQDGEKVALPEGFFTEVLVGLNFGCCHWESKKDE